ncbi:hypothetical protein A5686_06120 [Mycobacterium sp. E2479]|nr:hypothetical protein A5686_06120 [Mycobacterium sp. E2479]
MNLWASAFDDMNAIDGNYDRLTLDQKLKVAEIKAYLTSGRGFRLFRTLGSTQHGVRVNAMSDQVRARYR